LRSIPIDPARVSLAFIDAAPVAMRHPETRQVIQGRQAGDENGVPLWQVNALAVVSGEQGGETVRIKVPHDSAPAFEPLARIECENLLARSWELEGRSGISLSASAIRLAGAGNGASTKGAARTAVAAGTGSEV
jgi:hypothetical protein